MVQSTGLAFGWDGTLLQEGATFEVERGSIFVILGGSGCGKSSLMRILVGLDAPQAGEVTIDGVAPSQDGAGRPRFGVLFQSGALLGGLTVGENVALPLQEWSGLPPDAIGGLVAAKLRLVGLKDAEDLLPDALSGGMRKRAALARAMALEPDLLFLIMLDRETRSIIARGDPRVLRDTSQDPRVRAFLTRAPRQAAA